MQYASANRCIGFILGESLWVSELLIRKYLILTITQVMMTSSAPALELIRSTAANSPALATIPADINAPCRALIPIFRAAIPSAKETAKYPRHIGIPSVSPLLNHFSFLITLLISSYLFLFFSFFICSYLFWLYCHSDSLLSFRPFIVILSLYCHSERSEESFPLLYCHSEPLLSFRPFIVILSEAKNLSLYSIKILRAFALRMTVLAFALRMTVLAFAPRMTVLAFALNAIPVLFIRLSVFI